MKNAKFMGQVTFSDGTSKLRLFATEEAKNNWANKQYKKDIGATVEILDYDTLAVLEVWHA